MIIQRLFSLFAGQDQEGNGIAVEHQQQLGPLPCGRVRGDDARCRGAVRGVQVPAAQVPAGVRVRALLPAGGAAEVRQRAQGVRRQQRDQAAQRAAAAPAGGRRELARLRGRGARQGPRLRLRRRHLRAPAPGPPPAEGAGRRARRAPPLRLRRRRRRHPHRAPRQRERQRRAQALHGNDDEPRAVRCSSSHCACHRRHVRQQPEARGLGWRSSGATTATASGRLLLHAEPQQRH